jgi:hypothetical protein
MWATEREESIVAEFAGLTDCGKALPTTKNQEYRKRNKSVRVDKESGFAHAAVKCLPENLVAIPNRQFVTRV